MDAHPRTIEFYLTKDGRCPFREWFLGLKDIAGRAKIRKRLDRLESGNFGDWRSAGNGVGELRLDFGPGYRIYFGQMARTVVILLCGGDKGSQSKDIERAKELWRDCLSWRRGNA